MPTFQFDWLLPAAVVVPTVELVVAPTSQLAAWLLPAAVVVPTVELAVVAADFWYYVAAFVVPTFVAVLHSASLLPPAVLLALLATL